MKIFDISRTLSNDLAPWPGDTSFHFELKWKMAEGATVNVGAMNMGVHNGTHADAVFHFDPNGETIERMSLETYVGGAVVVDLTEIFRADRTRQICVGDLESAHRRYGTGNTLERHSNRSLILGGAVMDEKFHKRKWLPCRAFAGRCLNLHSDREYTRGGHDATRCDCNGRSQL